MPRDLRGLPKLAQWLGFRGYRSSAPKEEDGDYMSRGSQNVMLTGSGKTQAFKGLAPHMLEAGGPAKGGIVMMNVAEEYASLGTGQPIAPDTDTAYGNVFNVYASLFYIGKGLLRLTGESLGVWADSILSLLVKRSGGYTDPASGPWQAGLQQPSAPTIRAITPPAFMTGKCNGLVSVVIWRIRSSTGAVSIRSEPSNIAAASNQSIAVSFPDADFNGQDYWGIGVTRNGEGAVGSYFELIEVPEYTPESGDTDVATGMVIEGALEPRTIAIEWRDGDLIGREFAPSRDFPPPAGFFAGAIEDIVIVDGTYAESDTDLGSAIAPSEPGRPESFSPDTVIFTNDFPTGLLRGEGLYWRFGRNSCYLVRYLGGEKPMSVELAWEGLGISHQHNACLAEGGRLYVWPDERSPMRLSETGRLDGAFSTDIADDVAACDDPLKRVVGWDGKSQVVAFCYERTIWCWFAALDGWGAPLDLSEYVEGYITSCVTENGILLLSDSHDNLWEFNAGSGSLMKVRTGWAMPTGSMDSVSMVQAGTRCDNTEPITIEVFADGDDTTPASSIEVTPLRTGYQRLPSVWPNVQDCESHAIQITMRSTTPTGDVGVESITSYGDAHSMVR